MVERISSRQFHASDGVDDWRIVFGGATAYFAAGTFSKGAELVNEIARLADAANHHPDVDLRYAGVTVRLYTHNIGDISERDIAPARQISDAARERVIAADSSAVQTVQIAIDAFVIPGVLPFWRVVLGYDQRGDEDLVDPNGHAPSIWFQHMDAPRPQRDRIHIDVSLSRDHVEARIAPPLAAGGQIASNANAPHWWTLANSEGNEVDVAPWADDSD